MARAAVDGTANLLLVAKLRRTVDSMGKGMQRERERLVDLLQRSDAFCCPCSFVQNQRTANRMLTWDEV